MATQITASIPNDLAVTLSASWQDPARAALEAIALEACRQRHLTGYQLWTLPGTGPAYGLDGFLNARHVYGYATEDSETDLASVRQLPT